MSKALLITVGTGVHGHDIASAILKSIEVHNPERVVFASTAKSYQETIQPHVLAQPVMKGRACDDKRFTDPDDVQQTSQEALLFLEQLLLHYGPEEIVVDFTSGTKVMSAGVVLAAVQKGVMTLNYVSGKRGEGGRVIPGTEKLVSLSPTQIYAEQSVREAIGLFNIRQFKGSLELLQEARVQYPDPHFQKRVDFLEKITRAFWNWDLFALDSALSLLDSLNSEGYRDFRIAMDLGRARTEWIKFLGVERQHKPDNLSFPDQLVADLLENADRRKQEGRFDDAGARLYRLLEYVAQYRLFHAFGIRTGDVDLGKLPDGLRPVYEARRKNGKIQLALEQSYVLLKELGDPLGERFHKDEQMLKVLIKRNNSILAHGFEPLGRKDVEMMMERATSYASSVIPQLDELRSIARFPTIEPRQWERLREAVVTP